MKRNLIKSLLISGLILGGVWNHEVAYSSDATSSLAMVPSGRGVTLERAKEIFKTCETNYGYIIFLGAPSNFSKIRERCGQTGLFKECSEEELQKIIDTLIPIWQKKYTYNTPCSECVMQVYDVYAWMKKGILGKTENERLEPTKLAKEYAKKGILGLSMIYDIWVSRLISQMLKEYGKKLQNKTLEDKINTMIKIMGNEQFVDHFNPSDMRKYLLEVLQELNLGKGIINSFNIFREIKGGVEYFPRLPRKMLNAVMDDSELDEREKDDEIEWQFNLWNYDAYRRTQSPRYSADEVGTIYFIWEDFTRFWRRFSSFKEVQSICKEVEQEYTSGNIGPKDYARDCLENNIDIFKELRSNDMLQLSFRYLEEKAFLGGFRGCIQFPFFNPDPTEPSALYADFMQFKKLNFLLKSNSYFGSLPGYFCKSDPITGVSDNVDERRMHNLIRLYYNMTGENPLSKEEYDKVIDGNLIELLKKEDYERIAESYNNQESRQGVIKTIIINFLKSREGVNEAKREGEKIIDETIIDELIRRNILTEDDRFNALRHLVDERKYTEILVLYNVANKNGRKNLCDQMGSLFQKQILNKYLLYFNELIKLVDFMQRIK